MGPDVNVAHRGAYRLKWVIITTIRSEESKKTQSERKQM